ncbi:Glycosyl hydrolases family 16 [uncultured archaeon]|nr:Glycosyl hydrolases family 16 [uncultured archaeon]
MIIISKLFVVISLILILIPIPSSAYSKISDDFINLQKWTYWTKNQDPSCVPAIATYDGSTTIAQLHLRGDSCIILPGNTEGANLEFNNATGFGKYSIRMKTASAPLSDGLVNAFFIYSYRSQDDVSEIDFEMLSSEPEVVHNTIWTSQKNKVERKVNLVTGEVLMTRKCAIIGSGWNCRDLYNIPSKVSPLPNFNHTRNYYIYTFIWSRNSVKFYVSDDSGQKTTLWSYYDYRNIPYKPAKPTLELWHTNDWGQGINSPTNDVFVNYDWFSYTPN